MTAEIHDKNSRCQSIESYLSLLEERKETITEYDPLLLENGDEKKEWQFVKAADKISAWLKCVDERNMGNTDFADAEKSILHTIEKMGEEMSEVKYFMDNFAPAYKNTLDESSRVENK